MNSLREKYLLWREAVARRSAAGDLRVSSAEREALDRFTTSLESYSDEDRSRWEAERSTIDAEESNLCACTHPVAHHDPSGSCFHVVGCSTGCDCIRV